MNFEFTGKIWYWKGPAPFFFVTMPEAESDVIHDNAAILTYGWGMIPVRVQIGDTVWTTAMFRKDNRYIVPIKDMIRKAEGIGEGDEVTLQVQVTSI